jgi:Ca2+-binding RTX toxin-like protein
MTDEAESGAVPALAAALAGANAADAALGGPAARSSYGSTGAGIRVGILSDSYDVNGRAAAAVAQGLLPAGGNGIGATVLQEGPAGSTDEGQAMAELVHATAPDAQLYFASSNNGEASFAANIAALAAAGCQVIVDDTLYEDEPFFQIAGPIDQAVQQALGAGVSYFSAAGNAGRNFFEGAFTPVLTTVPGIGTGEFESFPGGSLNQTLVVSAGQSPALSLQWAAPYAAANPPTLTLFAVSASGAVTQSFQPGQAPGAVLGFPAPKTTQSYAIYIEQTPGTPSPGLFKEVVDGNGSLGSPGLGAGSGSITGHDLVPGVNVVGAINAGDLRAPAPYTSTGPGELLFGANGTPLALPQPLGLPSFLAPDGAATSVFDPFYGSSAAAASAAAVAALMLQTNRTLSNADLSTLLTDSALPTGVASVAGAGLIEATLAVGYAATRVISGSPQATVEGIAQPCTLVSGAGAQALLAGSGRTLIGAEGTADTVIAGSGADTVDLAGASALLFGSSGPLWVRTLGGAATLAGGAGSMTVSGGAGGGVEYGSASGSNLLTAGNEPTTLVSTGPNDTLAAAGGGHDALIADGSGPATLQGGGAADNVFVSAGTGNHLIACGPGSNLVYLGSGADTASGGPGSLILQAGAGAALAFGGAAGHNLLLAGTGASTLVGGGAGDTLQGSGTGDLLVAAASGNDTLLGGTGTEVMVGGGTGVNIYEAAAADALIAPGAAESVVNPGSGQSTVVAGAGVELFNFVAGATGGADFILGFAPSHQMVRLAGYGAAAEQAALAGQYDTGGNAWLTLPDGTVVAFVGLSHLSAANVVIA